MAKKKRSIKVPTQLRRVCPSCSFNFWHFIPYGDESVEKIKEFTLYQILESRFTGSTRERSIAQLGLYWACCKEVAELTSDHENILDRRDIDFDVKIRVAKKHPWMIKRFRVVNGIAHLEMISIAFQNLKVLDANKYFDKAFKELSGMAQMSEDDLIALTKSKMR